MVGEKAGCGFLDSRDTLLVGLFTPTLSGDGDIMKL